MNQRTKLASALLILAVAFSPAAWAQEVQKTDINSYKQSPERYFRLTFRVLNLSPEGKMIDSKSYNEIIASGPKSQESSSIRTGDRVPVATGNYATGGSNLMNTQFQYIDIGTKIDATRAAVIDQPLRLHIIANISGMPTKMILGGMHEPVIRQTSWD